MAKLSTDELKALLAAEKTDSLAGTSENKLSRERSDAMDYYMGDVSKDMPFIEGRSGAVSSDVADTIEGLMPGLMEIFAGSDEVVRFDPVSEEDVDMAEQESDVVNWYFMQKNDGFLVLYSMIKDALLQKLGIVKVWSEEVEEEETERYIGITDDQLAILLEDEDIEIIEQTEHQADDADVAAY